MPVKKITESQMLSTILCPAYLKYNYDPYSLDLSQAIAKKALVYFLTHVEDLYRSCTIDQLIDISIKKAAHKKLTNTSSSYKKRIHTHASNFISTFIDTYPPDRYYPILLDLNVPLAFESYEISLNFTLILKDLHKSALVVYDLIHANDFHVKNNLDYFSAKKYIIADRLSFILENPISYFCFYIPPLKPLAQNQSIDISFIPIPQGLDSMNYYLNIFKSKIRLNKNPFCINYSCPKRKECTHDKSW